MKIDQMNIDYPKRLLSACFNNDTLYSSTMVEMVDESDFCHVVDKVIFRSIKKLLETNQPIDFIGVAEDIQVSDIQDKECAMLRLSEMMNISLYTTKAFNFYLVKFIESLKREKTRLLGLEITTIADQQNEVDGFIDDIKQKLQKIQERLVKNKIKNSELLATNFLTYLDGETSAPLYTGFDFDRTTRGFKPKQLIIVGARPGVGKSAFVLSIANRLLKAGKRVILYSMEMSANDIIIRLQAIKTNIPITCIENTKGLTDTQLGLLTKASEELSKQHLIINDEALSRPIEIRVEIQKQINIDNKPDIVIIDHLGLLNPSERTDNKSIYQRTSEISRELKQMAMQFDIPFLVPAQLNRKPAERKDNKPILSDLRDSGTIEQDADIVMLLHRESEHDEDADQFGADVIIAKNRNGATRSHKMTFIAELTKFADVDNSQN